MKREKINNDVSMPFKENAKIYDIKNQNSMSCINEKQVNKISQSNLLQDILNISRLTKHLNRISSYSTWMY